MAAQKAPPCLGFSRQEHWSGLPFPSPVHESGKWIWEWSRSVVSNPQRPPWTAAFQAPLSIGFSKQEYWSGVPLPSLSKLLTAYYKSSEASRSVSFSCDKNLLCARNSSGLLRISPVEIGKQRKPMLHDTLLLVSNSVFYLWPMILTFSASICEIVKG